MMTSSTTAIGRLLRDKLSTFFTKSFNGKHFVETALFTCFLLVVCFHVQSRTGNSDVVDCFWLRINSVTHASGASFHRSMTLRKTSPLTLANARSQLSRYFILPHSVGAAKNSTLSIPARKHLQTKSRFLTETVLNAFAFTQMHPTSFGRALLPNSLSRNSLNRIRNRATVRSHLSLEDSTPPNWVGPC